ncbi:MAG: SDR family NAD(P)-dependent oxidoreductase [Anaplasma ovis]|uniref:Pteridine reductase n=1 Tax=Anaplasma ovis str. Haibei TaxID=1248439 RepID=A0A2Z2L935_9RICK|nr:SDR family NAD(P)-dependent oxidoreductase [Anaplasma ovis]ASI48117.1 pteridine reductase [Anaplasma ovis str. Haibei]
MHKRGVIITGAARRVGRAVAVFLAARHGYDVVVHYNRSHSEALDLQRVIQEDYGKRCLLFQSDLRDFAALGRLVAYAFEEIPHCDTLINNASVFYASTIGQLREGELEENYKIHVKAPIFLTQHFARMCAAKRGNVVNIIDTNITRTQTRYFAYLLSKKALSDFTVMAAEEFAVQLQVNAICPPKIPDREIDGVKSLEDMEAPCLKNFLDAVATLVDRNNTLSGKLIHTNPATMP